MTCSDSPCHSARFSKELPPMPSRKDFSAAVRRQLSSSQAMMTLLVLKAAFNSTLMEKE